MSAAAPRRRRGPLLLLLAMISAAALFMHFGVPRWQAPPLRFTVQAEPRGLPPLEFVDAAGRPASLAALRGKPVLLNIWATWCPPCRQEMPSLDRLQRQLGGDELEVVALSIDIGANSLPAIAAFYASLGLKNLRVYHDASGTAGFRLGAPGVPTTLLLDREGREIGRISGPAQWDGAEAVALIRQHLAAAPAVPHSLEGGTSK